MKMRCPACHADFSLEQALEDTAAREMMVVLGDLPREVSRPLVMYIGLWRSKTRALAWDRALRVAQEVLEMGNGNPALGTALADTVESLRKKQDAGSWKPLTGHNYLKQVLESQPAHTAAPAVIQSQQQATGSKTLQAVTALLKGSGNG